MSKPRSVAVVVFDGVNAVDVAGPLEAFGSVKLDNGSPAYQPVTWSANKSAVKAESGLTLLADGTLPERPRADYLLVPGGAGVRKRKTLEKTAHWLAKNERAFGTIVSICTGAYILAESGLVDGLRATTHWAHISDISRRYPHVRFDPDPLFLKEGRYFSSGGVTSGIDLALELIERDFGPYKALEVARQLVVYLKRTGSQSQFSEPLKSQISGTGRFEDTCRWAVNNLDSDLSIDTLSTKANVSPRHFSRRFIAQFGMPPASYFQKLRLDLARTMLERGDGKIDQIYPCTGFKSADVFRRAFERHFHLTPSEYRSRFSKTGAEL